MPIKIPAPERKIVYLTQVDEDYGLEEGESPTFVEVRQARTREIETLGQLYSKYTRRIGEEGERDEIIFDLPLTEEIKLKVRLTLVSSNMLAEDGKSPLFKFGPNGILSVKQFDEAWGNLPEDVALAIYNAVLEVNPQWDGRIKSTGGSETKTGE